MTFFGYPLYFNKRDALAYCGPGHRVCRCRYFQRRCWVVVPSIDYEIARVLLPLV